MDEIVLTPKEMALCDAFTMKKLNITDYALMRKAAKGLFDYAFKKELLTGNQIAILVGPGNNGGDGVVFGEYLINCGFSVTLYLVGNPQKRSDSLKEALKDFPNQNAKVSIHSIDDLNDNKSKIKTYDLFIDALFGSGLNKPLKGLFNTFVSYICSLSIPVISLDVPSGINAYNGKNMGVSIKAKHTLIVQHFKTGNLLFDAPDFHGEHHVVDVGIVVPDLDMVKVKPSFDIIFKSHKKNIHKYQRGTGLMIGGSKALEGALIMASLAALKTGLGLVTALFDAPNISGKTVPLEVLTYHKDSLDDFSPLMDKKDAYLFGPGLNKDDAFYKKILKRLIETKKPLIIDAGGIDYFKALFNKYVDLSNVIITPHVGELAHFYDVNSNDIINDPLKWIKPLTDKKVHVLLKGTCSIVANHLKQFYLYHPNPALAKGGSGDVLSGLILGNLPYHSIENAIQYAVRLMNKTVEYALKDFPEESLLPSDILNYLPKTINMLK